MKTIQTILETITLGIAVILGSLVILIACATVLLLAVTLVCFIYGTLGAAACILLGCITTFELTLYNAALCGAILFALRLMYNYLSGLTQNDR